MFTTLRRMATVTVVTISMLCHVGVAQAGPAVNAVLDQTADNAAILIVIPNLTTLNTKIALLNNELGIGAPHLANALGNIKMQTGIAQGLREDGPMAIALSNLPFDGPGEPNFHVLLPVTDYKAFITAVGGDAAKPVASFTPPQGGETLYAKQAGAFAVISNLEADVANYKPAGAGAALTAAAGKLGNRYIDSADVLVMFNMPLLATPLRAQLKQVMESTKAQVGDVQQIPIAVTMANLCSTALDAAVRDATSAAICMDIKDKGLGLTYTAQFKPDSPTGKLFTTGASAGGKLNVLPGQPYIMASAMNLQGIGVEEIADKIAAAFPDNADPNQKIIRDSVGLIKTLRSGTMGYYLPSPGAARDATYNMVSAYETAETDTLIKTWKEYVVSLNGMKAPVDPLMPDGAEAAEYSTKIVPNSLKIDSVTLDQYTIAVKLPPAVEQQLGPMMPLIKAFGGMGSSGYIGAVNNHALITNTLDAQLVNKTIESIRKGQGLGANKDIVAAREELPPDASVEGYINVGVAQKMVQDAFAAMQGMPPGAAPAAELPPFAMGLGIRESGMAGRLFMPYTSLKAAKDQAMGMIMMMMMGGGGMGGEMPVEDEEPTAF